MIRKGNTRLHRPCDKCQEMFEPSGKSVRVCNKCKGESMMDRLFKLQRRLQ